MIVRMETKICAECEKPFEVKVPLFCGRDCFHKNYGKNHKGDRSPHWKGDDVGYDGIHTWLTREFGKGTNCEHCGEKRKLHWAKITDKEYERKRENFIELCSSCHKKYDFTNESRIRMSESHKGKVSPKKGKKYPKAL